MFRLLAGFLLRGFRASKRTLPVHDKTVFIYFNHRRTRSLAPYLPYLRSILQTSIHAVLAAGLLIGCGSQEHFTLDSEFAAYLNSAKGHGLIPPTGDGEALKALPVYRILSADFKASADTRAFYVKAKIQTLDGVDEVDLGGFIENDGTAQLKDLFPIDGRHRLVGAVYCADLPACQNVVLKIYFKVGRHVYHQQFVSPSLLNGRLADADERATTDPATHPVARQEQILEREEAQRPPVAIATSPEASPPLKAAANPPGSEPSSSTPFALTPPPAVVPLANAAASDAVQTPYRETTPWTSTAPQPSQVEPTSQVTQATGADADSASASDSAPGTSAEIENDNFTGRGKAGSFVGAKMDQRLLTQLLVRPLAQERDPHRAEDPSSSLPAKSERAADSPRPAEQMPEPSRKEPTLTSPPSEGKNSTPQAEEEPSASPTDAQRLAPLTELKKGGVAVGFINNGHLRAGTLLPNPTDYLLHTPPSRGASYGTGLLTSLLIRSASHFSKKVYPDVRVSVNNLSAKNGGYLKGHSSHQTGLDADIRYLPYTKPTSVIRNGKIVDDFNFEMNWQYFRLLVSQNIEEEVKNTGQFKVVSVVDRIFVPPTLKKAFCTWAKKRGLLSGPLDRAVMARLQEEPKHITHFHLRLRCSPHYPACQNRDDIPTDPDC